MFTIHEIETENKLSVFPRFYAALASSIRSVCGDRGEGAVRQAIRLYAARQAGALCSAHKAAGVKQNVKSYQCAGDCMIDSRERSHYQQLCEEVCIKEIYTCPFVQIWRQDGTCDVGRWYCEEYEKAKFEAYTHGLGQLHLSELLTEPRHNSCRFAMYYRLSNLSPAAAADAFTENRHAPAKVAEWTDQFRQTPGQQCLQLVRAMYDACGEEACGDGRRALAEGLRRFTASTLENLRSQAVRTLHACDGAFAARNFALPLDKKNSIYDENTEADRMLAAYVLRPMRRALGMED